MMEKAIVLINVDPRLERLVLREIRSIRGVKQANYIYGPYDIAAKIEVETMDELQDTILNRIRDLYGVSTTMTCYIYDS
jgi:DNA-binding Lrp family transcriptional regulator